MLTGYLVRKIEHIFRDIQNGNHLAAATNLETSSVAEHFNGELVEAFCRGLREGKWDPLQDQFLRKDFINSDGLVLWMAPYKQRRNGKIFRALSGIFGIAPVEDSYSEIRAVARTIFGDGFHPAPEIIGVRRFSSFGLAGGAAGEAFLVPNGWEIGDVSQGPALNDMTEQFARLRTSEPIVRRILSEESADLILTPILDTISGVSTQNLEFQFHEVAHSIGLGFADKFRLGFFKSFHNCAVEEWRSDGISFCLMAEMLNDEHRGRLVAANLALRLSVDALRTGGLENDSDAHASGLILQDLLDADAATFAHGKLELTAKTYVDLAGGVDLQRKKAWRLTQEELGIKGEAKRLNEIYSEISLRNNTKEQLKAMLMR